MSSGPVCFHVEAQEADGESKDALMGGNQSTDPDVPTPLDSILKNDVVQANTTKIEQSPAHVSHPVGLNGCKSALHAMKKYNFDEDSRKCILTLIKYVDNVIHRYYCYLLILSFNVPAAAEPMKINFEFRQCLDLIF